ncbi:MAG TPA: carboxypeptidase regulatory-like domain-containing protein [Pyrinomonadaceae bacterium]|jgi:outer membrane receptor protein involved in Fe transport
MLLAALAALVLIAPHTHAQLTRGAINGTVRDEAGAAIAGATVRVNDPAKNISREATTNEEGFYRIAALDPGTYTVTIQGTGFGTLETREVVVNVASETSLDATLKAGGVTETVNVTAQADAITLNKTTATVGLTVSQRQVVDLPTGAARNINNLALLSPNVFSAPGSSGISANGQRARNNNFTIDGSDNNDISITVATTSVVPEAVGEFQVQTNPFSVEFGRNSGAQINVITRSGTNEFHGDVFEYYRGSRLASRDNLEKAAGLQRPGRFNRNQFGFDIGGPVMLPNLIPGEGNGDWRGYDGRDRTFFFYLFQGDRLRTGAGLGATIRVPTPAGFAALQSVPLGAGQTAASRQAVLSRLGFLGAVYGGGAQFRNLTNVTVNGVAVQTGQTNVGIIQPSDQYNNTLRFDHKLGESDNLTVRYISNKSVDVNVISNLQFGSQFAGNQNILDQNLAASETHIFGPNVLNEFRFSYIRRNLAFPENDPNSPTATISGLFTIGGASNFPQGRVQNSYQFSDTLSWLAGAHSLKFGTDIRHIRLNNLAAFDTKGTFTFNNLQDYLNNNAFSFQQALQTASFFAVQTQQYYFVQDDWRVRPNLTLNLGLRYETSNNPFGFFGAESAQVRSALVPGPVGRDNDNFAPAVGFAYSPRPSGGIARAIFGDGLSSIRGGWRRSFDVLFYNILTVNGSNFPRVVVGLQNNVQNVYPNLLPVTANPVFDPLAGFVNTPETAKTPESYIYSLSWQREFLRSYFVEVGYAGSRSINQVNQLQANPAILTAAQIATVRAGGTIPGVQARRLFPQFGSRTLIATEAQASYNAGYVNFNKRLTRGLQLGAAYTFSKLMDDNSESLGVAAITGGSPQIPQDFFNRKAEKSLSAFDRRHRFVANFTYEIPAFPGDFFKEGVGRQIFGGWEFSGIIQRQSGQPFTVLTGVDTNGNGTATGDRPNYNPGGILRLDPVTGDFRTFTSPLVGGQFVVPLGTNGLPLANSLGNGNLGRNTFRAPGFYNTDLSLQKYFTMPWGEDNRLIFRADFLNAFNQDNYGRPVVLLNSPDFGRNLNNWGARTITLSAKYRF